MSKKANASAIGAFVLLALVLAAAALALLGSGRLFKQTTRYVVFFEGSLSGLDVGAPVEFEGVRVGTVTGIQIRYDTANETVVKPVYVELDPARISYVGPREQGQGLGLQIQRGLRAQLQSQSLVTGRLKVMLVSKTGSPLRIVGADPETPEIPSIPTLTDSVMAMLYDLPVHEIAGHVNRAMAAISQALESGALTNAAGRMSSVLLQVEALSSNVNQALPSMLDSATANADRFLKLQEDISGLLKEITQMMAVRSPERQQFIATMRSVEDATLALRDLLNYLQLHPEALITGKKED